MDNENKQLTRKQERFAIGLAKLKINHPDLTESFQTVHFSPRSCCNTGWSSLRAISPTVAAAGSVLIILKPLFNELDSGPQKNSVCAAAFITGGDDAEVRAK